MTSSSRRALLARCAGVAATIVPLAGCLAEDGDDPDAGDGGDEPAAGGNGTDSGDCPAPADEYVPPDGEDERQPVELEAHLQDEVIYVDELDSGDGETVTMEILSEDGEPVTSGRVMVEAGTAKLSPPKTEALSGSNEVSFTFSSAGGDEVSLRTDQNSGTLGISIFPPSDTDYVDALENSEIIVVDGSSP